MTQSKFFWEDSTTGQVSSEVQLLKARLNQLEGQIAVLKSALDVLVKEVIEYNDAGSLEPVTENELHDVAWTLRSNLHSFDWDYDKSKRGIDYDLEACLENNPQDGFTINDIYEVLAVWEGQNDEDDWRWIFRLNDGRYIFMQGGCDYTGWDCQSWASHNEAATPTEAALFAVSGELPTTSENSPFTAGLGHMIGVLSGEYMSDEKISAVYKALVDQLNSRKNMTWREKMDKEMGVKSN